MGVDFCIESVTLKESLEGNHYVAFIVIPKEITVNAPKAVNRKCNRQKNPKKDERRIVGPEI